MGSAHCGRLAEPVSLSASLQLADAPPRQLLRVQTAANLASQANCGASLLGGLPLQGIFSQQARDVLDGFPKRENVIQQVWE